MSQRVITGVCRLSYLWALEPKINKKSGKSSYGVMLLIPKTDKKTIADIQAAIKAEWDETKGAFGFKGDKIPGSFKTPLHDGDVDRPEDETCKGMMYLNASSFQKPDVVDKKLQVILDPDLIYPGMWGRVSLNIKAFDNDGKGITAYLNNIQKIRDDKRLDGRTSGEYDFNDGTEWTDADDADQTGEDDDLL